MGGELSFRLASQAFGLRFEDRVFQHRLVEFEADSLICSRLIVPSKLRHREISDHGWRGSKPAPKAIKDRHRIFSLFSAFSVMKIPVLGVTI